MNTQLNFLGLVVKDLAATTRFFTDVLGYKLDEAGSFEYYSQFEMDSGARLGLVLEFPEGEAQQLDPAFMVDDVDATYADYLAKGVEMVTEIEEKPFGRSFLFRTPEGHVLRIWKPAGPV